MLSERPLTTNNFDFLRLFAATLVLVNHTFPFTGSKFDPFTWLSGYESMGGFAVAIFFIISGFLITKSWVNSPNISIFFKKRFLRIFPGLICAILFCVFIIGPITTKFSIKDYLSHPLTYRYLLNISLFYMSNSLPGVFVGNLYPYTVNGSIWTLSIELIAYFLVAALGFAGVFKNRRLVLLSILLLLVAGMAVITAPGFSNPSLYSCVPYKSIFKNLVYFFIGALIYLYRDRISLSPKLALVALVVYVCLFRTPLFQSASFVLLPYLVIWAAYANTPYLRGFSRYGDFSYGVYVYAFPVQQTIVSFTGPNINKLVYFFSALSVTLVFAFMSWHIIEKPALKLKKTKIFST